jgi:hypothetical protein
MTRNKASLLPFCRYCGQYKGIGQCKNPSCASKRLLDADLQKLKNGTCMVCRDSVSQACYRCGKGYCTKHSEGSYRSTLTKLDQHLGTCVICGKIICENCWIFNQKGEVTCQIHHPSASITDSDEKERSLPSGAT